MRNIKKRLSFLLAVAVFVGCLGLNTLTGFAVASSASVGMDQLLRGFNLFGGKELKNENTLTGIFKPTVAANLADLYGYTNISTTDEYGYTAKSFSELQEKSNSQFGIGMSAEVSQKAVIYSWKASMSAKYSRTNKSDYSSSIDTYFYEYGSLRREGKNAFTNWNSPATQQRIQGELDDYFLGRLKTDKNIRQLFKDYGTHIITSYTLGGNAGLTVSTVETKKSSNRYAKDDFDSKVSLAASAFGVSGSAEFTASYMKETQTLDQNSNYSSNTKAFANGGRGMISTTPDPVQLNLTMQNWVASIKPGENTTVLVDGNLQLAPIWDLLPSGNEARRRELQQEFQNMMIEFDTDFNNTYLYQAAISGDRTVSVDVHPSGAPSVSSSGKIEISKASQFINIGTRDFPANGNYIMTNNISLEGQTRFETMNTPFTGTFDGNGFSISDFNIEKTVAPVGPYGLFQANKGTIKNLTIKDSSIVLHGVNTPTVEIGLVVGANQGMLENVQVERSTLKIDGVSYMIMGFSCGGIVGKNYSNGTISKCCYTGRGDEENIEVHLDASSIYSSIANAQTNVTAYAGGVAGINEGAIRDCYTDVPVTMEALNRNDSYFSTYAMNTNICAGGIAGFHSDNKAVMERCFAVGAVSAIKKNINGGNTYSGLLAGMRSSSAAIKDSYCISGKTSVGYGGNTGVKSVASYKNADMVNLLCDNGWVDMPAYSYPRLPGIAQNFDVYYKGSIPTYEQNYSFPADLSTHMKVFFGGIKDITDEVSLRYNFNNPGTRKIQLTFMDDTGAIFTGDMDATVVAADTSWIEAPTAPSVPGAGGSTGTAGDTGSTGSTGTTGGTAPDAGVQPLDPGAATRPGVSEFYAEAIESGVKMEWPVQRGDQYYRVFRSRLESERGISVTDFAITSAYYVDVNMNPGTTYYYSLFQVLADADPFNDKPELLSAQIGKTQMVKTFDKLLEPVGTGEKHFILMMLNDPYMTVDGIKQLIDPPAAGEEPRNTAPITRNDRTVVPIRAIIEAMGGKVGWEDATQKISLTVGDREVEMWLDKKDLFVNGVEKEMDVAPVTVNSRTVVPVRFAAESTGCTVEWLSRTSEIVVVFYKD